MKIPYGIADFYALVRNGYVYLDRTTHIRRLEELGRTLLFVRPRRFGKSLLLHMLSCYYDLRLGDEHDALFGELAVGTEPTPEAHHYFILRWSFASVDPSGSVADIGHRLQQYVLGTVEAFLSDYREHLSEPVEVVEEPVRTLEHLLAAIRRTPYPLYLLIDEYDNFANEVIASDSSVYDSLVRADGPFKQLFKWVKDAMQGKGLERLFLTGVSPVVLMDLTSGLNICRNVSQHAALDDLCGFREEEVRSLVERAVADAGPDAPAVDDAMEMMRTWYNGYRFTPRGRTVYNPTLAFYFLLELQESGRYPRQLLDANLSADELKLRNLGRVASGKKALIDLIQTGKPVEVDQVADHFRLSDLLRASPTDTTFLGSFLYYFGMLTFAGDASWGGLLLDVPNLVVRKLYIDEVERFLLPDDGDRSDARRPALALMHGGDIGPLARFIESTVFRVFSNRDYRWLNELAVKTAFLTVLFNDASYYVVSSEPELDRGYADLCLLRRPDARRYELYDLLIEFKHVKLAELGHSEAELRELDDGALAALKPVAAALDQAEAQLGRYAARLREQHDDWLRLRSYAVVALGFVRLVAREVGQ